MSEKRETREEDNKKDTPRKKRSKSDRSFPVYTDVNSIYAEQEFKDVYGEAFTNHTTFDHKSKLH